MKTVITKQVAANLDKLEFGYWDIEKEEFVPVGKNHKQVAEALGCSVELIDALEMLVADIKDMVGADLRDIWETIGE